ncbi:hypothetical protein ACIGJO_29585 [Streptomyces sp. NPDC079020]|uniref:hypothetical protein n=1 Tax=Streptomyces sp. NPDC079020 TaxID=3365722 RepID=UPI0037CD976E
MIDELTALAEANPKSLTAAAARSCLVSLETTARLLAGGTVTGTEPEPSTVLNSDLLRAPELDFRVLLEEMVGLGILATERDGWRLRFSNVLRLLGTPDAIEEELHAHDPNDTSTRLSISQARRPLPGARVSPLPEQQIAGLVRSDIALRIVLGTDATCLDDVTTALTDQQQRTPSELASLIKPATPHAYRQALSAGKARSPHRLIVSDMRGFKPDHVETALRDATTQTREPSSAVRRPGPSSTSPQQVPGLRTRHGWSIAEAMVY